MAQDTATASIDLPLPPADATWRTRIFGADWRSWRDPDVPEWFDPIDALFARPFARGLHDKKALLADDESISYRDLRQRIGTAAAALRAIGVTPEQRVLLFGTDSVEYVVSWLAAVHCGAVPVVVSDLYKAKDLLYFLTDANVTTLLIDVEQLDKLAEIADALPSGLARIIVRGDLDAGARAKLAASLGTRALHDCSELMRATTPLAAGHQRHRNDITYMFYSGGTTGTAKGIVHLAHDFFLVPARHGAFWEYSSDDVIFATSKKYFTHGIWPGILMAISWGAAAVMTRQPARPEVVLRLLEVHNVTKLVTVPTILKNIVAAVQGGAPAPKLPHLKFVFSASEKIPPQLIDDFEALFGIEIFDSIGSSEVTYEWIANRPAESKRGSLGKPVFGYDIQLVDSNGAVVTTPNAPGEAWVRSNTSCLFYWRKYDKSRETFVGEWTRTGDNLSFDEDGFFWFVGRENDVFKVSGLWVSPIEIEAALTGHPAVREAAVVPHTNADGLIRAKAFVVLKDAKLAGDKLIQELGAAVRPLGGYKIPDSFVFMDELPRTTLLKINRKALRDV